MKKLLLFVALVFSAAGTYAQTSCANAVNITTNGTTVVPTITGAYPGNLCFNSNSSDVDPDNPIPPKGMWYKYTPSTPGIITVSSAIAANPSGSTGTDTRLSIFTGTCGTLVCAAFSDDVDPSNPNDALKDYRSRVVDFSVNANTTYYIFWDNMWSAASFSFSFAFTPQTCFKATGFQFLELPTETTASIGWTAPTGGSPQGYQVEWQHKALHKVQEQS
ncbi:hypothetical protein [Flavobacterium sp. 3HN19-14]|uniref:hypothetical protein n=1 Tax=Flavobacterium sp. 3HN19-14 TaxID=3448133 RepID=UPI003EDE941E